jgi:LruC domain-containing protein
MNMTFGQLKRLLNPYFTIFLLVACLSFVLSACNTSNHIPQPKGLEDIDIPDGFGFDTTRKVTLNITTENLNGQPIAYTPFEVYHSFDLMSENPTNGVLVFSGLTDSQGEFKSEIEFPGYIDHLLVNLAYVGLPSSTEVALGTVKEVNVHFAPLLSGQDLAAQLATAMQPIIPSAKDPDYTYTYLGAVDKKGVPSYLEEPRIPSARTLELINNSLPENKKVPLHHPYFIADGAEANLVMTHAAEVRVTFLHEGTGFHNALGYYYYNKNTPPVSFEEIDNLTVLFPNTSFERSGGGLKSGDTVQLKYKPGTPEESTVFPAGTEIAWFLVSHGWRGLDVGSGFGLYSSDSRLNIEKTPDLQRHTVLLYDDVEDQLFLGFEDIKRDSKSCDHDFNDAVFTVDVNPVDSLDLTGVEVADTGSPADSDGDGVKDIYDHYPDDPTKAFDNVYPNKDEFGSLAFEDQWPLKGDADFNDLIVDYQITQIMNAQNNVVELEASFLFRAAGAAYTNAFAFELPIPSSKVASVKGQWFAGSEDHSYQPGSSWVYLDLDPNGTEKNQTKAVIFVIDDTSTFLGRLVNTEETGTITAPKRRDLTIRFTEPQNLNILGQPPYNPFIITNIYKALASTCDCQDRGVEVHLPNHPPTDLANPTLFNTGHDKSNLKLGKSYLTTNNIPWAIHIPASFDYPKERVQVTYGHNYFADWATSGGSKSPDWFMNKTGYRNVSNLFDQSLLPPEVVVE